jgi:hypothetical protein
MEYLLIFFREDSSFFIAHKSMTNLSLEQSVWEEWNWNATEANEIKLNVSCDEWNADGIVIQVAEKRESLLDTMIKARDMRYKFNRKLVDILSFFKRFKNPSRRNIIAPPPNAVQFSDSCNESIDIVCAKVGMKEVSSIGLVLGDSATGGLARGGLAPGGLALGGLAQEGLSPRGFSPGGLTPGGSASMAKKAKKPRVSLVQPRTLNFPLNPPVSHSLLSSLSRQSTNDPFSSSNPSDFHYPMASASLSVSPAFIDNISPNLSTLSPQSQNSSQSAASGTIQGTLDLVLRELRDVKAQNRVIIQQMQQQQLTINAIISSKNAVVMQELPGDLQLPVANLDALVTLEQWLCEKNNRKTLNSVLSSCVANNEGNTTRACLRTLFSVEVARLLNWKGTGTKTGLLGSCPNLVKVIRGEIYL